MEPFSATPAMLQSIAFFDSLSKETLAAIAPGMLLKNCRQGSCLNPGDHDTVDFVYQGVAAVCTLTKTGSRKILFFQGPGRLLSHTVMGTKPNMLFYEFMEHTILLTMEREAFSRLVQEDRKLSGALFRHYETQLWRMGHQLKNTAGYLPMERKLAIKLWKLIQEFGLPDAAGTRLRFPLTVTQTADFIGIPRETASRAVKKLSDWGLILHQGRYYVVPDMQRLSAYCHSGRTE